MAIKPIIDVLHCGKRIRVEFALEHRGIAARYNILVNDKPVQVGVFAEEVMRWLGGLMDQKDKTS